MRKPIPSMTLALVAFALLTGFRGGGCGARHHDPAAMFRAHVDDMLDDVNATDAQRAQIDAIADQLLMQGKTLAQGQKDARAALLAQWDAGQPDPAKVHALVDQRIDALRALAHQAADGAIQAHGILSPEQRAQISKKAHRRLE